MDDRDEAELRALVLWDANVRIGKTLRAAACTGKVRFDSRAHALKGIRPRLSGLIQPYLCEGCHGWHLGDKHVERASRSLYLRKRQRSLSKLDRF